MPKESEEGLPESVSEKLPKHAQDIYIAAHDNALEQYRDPKERRGQESLEEVAHKVAWAAVKQKYHKDNRGEWVENEE